MTDADGQYRQLVCQSEQVRSARSFLIRKRSVVQGPRSPPLIHPAQARGISGTRSRGHDAPLPEDWESRTRPASRSEPTPKLWRQPVPPSGTPLRYHGVADDAGSPPRTWLATAGPYYRRAYL